MNLHFHIEQLLLRGGMIWVVGWAVDEGGPLAHAQVRLDAEGADSQTVEVELGFSRDDVAERFPAYPWAQKAGFLIYGAWGDVNLERAELSFSDESGVVRRVMLHPAGAELAAPTGRIGAARLMLGKAVRGIKRDGVQATARKALALSRHRARSERHGLKELVAQVGSSPVVWLVDHDMGGGANAYRRGFVAERLALGQVVVILGFQVSTLGYFVQIHQGQQLARFAMDDLDAVAALAQSLNLCELVYNCAVSFRQPLQVVALMQALKAQKACRLLVLLHDYFPVCPSHVLLDARGKFCGVPTELTDCNACLTKHTGGFVSMANVRDITLWRRVWGDLLGAADEVQVFSSASKALLARAYPALAPDRWQVRPHDLPFDLRALSPVDFSRMHIGVLGTLGAHKGAGVVTQLALEIRRREAGVPITVIGSLQSTERVDGVTVTGPYAPERLGETIRATGANVFLFPSIWPETFSYVVHELCALGLPVLCFDLGAPADLLKTYPQGKVVSVCEPAELFDELTTLWKACRPLESPFA